MGAFSENTRYRPLYFPDSVGSTYPEGNISLSKIEEYERLNGDNSIIHLFKYLKSQHIGKFDVIYDASQQITENGNKLYNINLSNIGFAVRCLDRMETLPLKDKFSFLVFSIWKAYLDKGPSTPNTPLLPNEEFINDVFAINESTLISCSEISTTVQERYIPWVNEVQKVLPFAQDAERDYGELHFWLCQVVDQQMSWEEVANRIPQHLQKPSDSLAQRITKCYIASQQIIKLKNRVLDSLAGRKLLKSLILKFPEDAATRAMPWNEDILKEIILSYGKLNSERWVSLSELANVLGIPRTRVKDLCNQLRNDQVALPESIAAFTGPLNPRVAEHIQILKELIERFRETHDGRDPSNVELKEALQSIKRNDIDVEQLTHGRHHRRLGLRRRHPNLTSEEKDVICDMSESGMSVRAIMEETGLSESGVRRILNERRA